MLNEVLRIFNSDGALSKTHTIWVSYLGVFTEQGENIQALMSNLPANCLDLWAPGKLPHNRACAEAACKPTLTQLAGWLAARLAGWGAVAGKGGITTTPPSAHSKMLDSL